LDHQSPENETNLIGELQKLEIFSGLDDEQLGEIAAIVKTKSCSRGEAIITEGEQDNNFYVVLSGCFEIHLGAKNLTLANIGVGQPIGEVGFIAEVARTATVTAIRESIVLVLEKVEFDVVCKDNPKIWHAISVALARRLLISNLGEGGYRKSTPNTIAIIPAGSNGIPVEFISQFMAGFSTQANVLLIDSKSISQHFPSNKNNNEHALARFLNTLENRYDHIVYLSDNDLTEWSAVAIKQADLVISVGRHDNSCKKPVALNKIETFVGTLHKSDSQRLILLHRKKYAIQGTAHWLRERLVKMHHHVANGNKNDFLRLARFIEGKAIGFVASGGGALCCAHIGIYKALLQSGMNFDIIGGTSGGAAMAAAFAFGIDPDEVERQTYDMFVTRKALGRYNIPIFSLLDHRFFDAELRRLYGNARIEDFWIPYFAVAADLTNANATNIRYGPIWQAIRASSALPALLPPFYTRDGEMLVDGGLVDNVPIGAMHELKEGPNIVVSFEESRCERFLVDYDSIPSRLGLLRMALMQKGRQRLRSTPSLNDALIRALLANRQDFRANIRDEDILLVPDLPEEVGFMDWQHSALLRDFAWEWTRNELERLRETGDATIERINKICR
jgi:NTE family protein